MPVKFNYASLKGFIKEHFGTNRKFAKFLTISETALYDRLANRTPFTQTEMDRVSDHFALNAEETSRLFFTKKNTENRIQETGRINHESVERSRPGTADHEQKAERASQEIRRGGRRRSLGD
ncbi:MAG: DUF739 family protein [Dialister sp.]|nr:DUF739 family protein [Dialister sp.]